MRTPNYTVVEDSPERLLLRDIGPWNCHPTITNAAEEVVAELAERLGDRPLYYIDSEGDTTQLLVQNGQFAGFA